MTTEEMKNSERMSQAKLDDLVDSVLEPEVTTEEKLEAEVEVEEACPNANPAEETGTLETEASLDAKALITEFDNKYKRLQADFDNFRRRTEKEKTQLATFIKSDLLADFLPILDNFERAMNGPVTEETKVFYEGLSMIQQGLVSMLEKHGLKAIEAVGKSFDPNLHQAVMREPNPDMEDDLISEVLQTGYTLNGHTVRPAMVKVVAN